MPLLTRSQLSTGSSHPSPFPLGAPERQRPVIAMISEHGDPAAAVGREAAGGQNVYVRKVGEALARLGWQVDMFTRKTNPQDAALVQHGPHCRTIRLVAGPETYIDRDQLFAHMPEFVAAFQRFQSQNGLRYPLIHSHYWMSGWAGLQLRQQMPVKLVHTYHSLGAVKYQAGVPIPPVAQHRLRVERQILESCDRVVATSPQERDDLRRLVSQCGRTQVIPCGTDVDNFQVLSKQEARAQLQWFHRVPVVLYVGRFDPRKGLETLVRAMAHLRDQNISSLAEMRLVIVGGSDPHQADGQERRRIEALVSELGLTDWVDFAGMIGHDRLPLYYSAADVCVVPSHYEPFGLVAIEAMACGTPVIASDVGGLSFTVVPEETGLLVSPRDVMGFAAAMQRTLTDRLWAQKARKQGAMRVRTHFSWAGVAGQLNDLYQSLLQPQPLPQPRSVLKVS
jgi:D-inositol-3-phosphate glycosyltransferase